MFGSHTTRDDVADDIPTSTKPIVTATITPVPFSDSDSHKYEQALCNMQTIWQRHVKKYSANRTNGKKTLQFEQHLLQDAQVIVLPNTKKSILTSSPQPEYLIQYQFPCNVVKSLASFLPKTMAAHYSRQLQRKHLLIAKQLLEMVHVMHTKHKLPHGHICAENIFVDTSNTMIASGTWWFLGDMNRYAATVQNDVTDLTILIYSISSGTKLSKSKLEQSVKYCEMFPELHNFMHGTISLQEMAKVIQCKLETTEPQKILTLGALQTGKSTIFKLNNIMNNKIDNHSKRVYAQIIRTNIVEFYAYLAKKFDEKQIKLQDEKLVTELAKIGVFPISYSDPADDMYAHIVPCILYCASSKELLQTYKLNQYQLYAFYGIELLLPHCDKIFDKDYEPSMNHILCARVKTTGILECDSKRKGTDVKLYDVGGARNERKKWMHCFDNVTGIIYTISLMDFAFKAYEDESTQRFEESMKLLENVQSNKYLAEVPIFVVFTGLDMLVNDQQFFFTYAKRNPYMQNIFTIQDYLLFVHSYVMRYASDISRMEVIYANTCDVASGTSALDYMISKFCHQAPMDPYNTKLYFPRYPGLNRGMNWKRCMHAFVDISIVFTK